MYNDGNYTLAGFPVDDCVTVGNVAGATMGQIVIRAVTRKQTVFVINTACTDVFYYVAPHTVSEW